jgi:L-ascorbate metabolism protein UlaG (beta-lactamase superfamily)
LILFFLFISFLTALVALAKHYETFHAGPVCHNFDGARFFLKGHNSKLSLNKMIDFFLARPIIPEWDYQNIKTAKPDASVDKLRLTNIGHATFLIQTNHVNILTDPLYQEYLGWALPDVIPKRVGKPGVLFENLPPIHLVLITHDHQDHLDFDCVRKLAYKHNPIFCVPLGFKSLFFQYGIPIARVVEMDWHTSYRFNDDVQIFFEPAYHWCGRNFVFDKNKRLWGSFLIKNKTDTLFFSCDTDSFDGKVFEDIHKRFAPIKVAFLSIGGYKPCILWRSVHADPSKVMNINKILNPQFSVAMHYDTYQRIADEDYKEPERKIKQLEQEQNTNNFQWIPIGQSWDVPA